MERFVSSLFAFGAACHTKSHLDIRERAAEFAATAGSIAGWEASDISWFTDLLHQAVDAARIRDVAKTGEVCRQQLN